ncbi:g11191 [Coccomyxa elongata]
MVKGYQGQQATSNATGATHHHLQQAHCHQRVQVALSACKLGEAPNGPPPINATRAYIKEEIALKSLLANARCAVHLYILVETEADAAVVRAWLLRLHSPWQPVSYTFVDVHHEAIRDHLQSIKGPSQGYMGYCGLARMFFTEILPDEDRVLWIDTDTVVTADICQIWQHFDHFNASQLVGYTGNPDAPTPHHPFGLCSCVALMDLRKMRAAGWGRSFVAAAVAAHLRDVNPAEDFPYGDQDVLRIVQRHRPETAYRLPSSWNVMPFCPEYDQAGYEQAPGAFIGILHFTCTIKQHMYVNLLGFGRWAWLVQYYAEMKWEWLNEGRTEQRMFERPPIRVRSRSPAERFLLGIVVHPHVNP